MTTKLVLLISALSFFGSVAFSIYFSNTIANYNFLYNHKTKQYNDLLQNNSNLISSFNSTISLDTLIKTDPSLTPINKSFP